MSFRTLGTSVDSLVEEFELGLPPETSDYSRKLVEFCSSRALSEACHGMEEKISNGPSSFSRFTFDMMLAWENPSCADDESHSERVAKEKEDRKIHLQGEVGSEHDDISLFYSDLMPLLVTEEPTVGEDAFVWLSSLLPLIADVMNARFTFEALTAPTANRLHFPAYDRFLKEIDK
ncbi:hypothetical protein QJS10_CPA08g00083 [Acorus calamus]|uniref:Uncharacterized protein n=1 Tax=Acorus calamus TaxID=4465 RepID=A0AAV9E9Z7_ACOCL|nr:hypothetical protein QJS10_CPA08g00083 [Acorus calamus]